MRKLSLLVLSVIMAVSANAQVCQGYADVKDSTESRFRGQFDFYVQDCWGVGLTLRKESSKYFGWNLIGVSYMSGWHRYETPDKLGIVNVRAAGVRFNVPIYKNFKFYAEATPGYTFIYAKSLEGLGYGRYFWRSTKTAHCFGLDCSAGFQVIKDVTLGYNFSFFVNKNGNSHIHWGRVSIIF